jgi:hypothetical protein
MATQEIAGLLAISMLCRFFLASKNIMTRLGYYATPVILNDFCHG